MSMVFSHYEVGHLDGNRRFVPDILKTKNDVGYVEKYKNEYGKDFGSFARAAAEAKKIGCKYILFSKYSTDGWLHEKLFLFTEGKWKEVGSY